MTTGLTAQTPDKLELGAGVLLKNFNFTNNTFVDADIICATRGGGSINIIPAKRDRLVDGAKPNTIGLIAIDYWTCEMSFTGIEITEELLRQALGHADITGTTNRIIRPRHRVNTSDFSTVYWRGERADGVAIVIQLDNVINSNGLVITRTDRGESTVSFVLRGNYGLTTQNTVPCAIHVLQAPTAP